MKDDDLLLHLEKTVTNFVADSEAKRPGVKASLIAGGNRLSIESSGPIMDDTNIAINDVEVITSGTLRANAQAVINENGPRPTFSETATLGWAGAGSRRSPMEAVVKLPIGSETVHGVVKIVNEGSHGFPAAGYSFPTAAIVYDPALKRGVFLRNGADDLEHDVFVSWVDGELGSIKYTATADRFRIPALPATAKPTYVLHSSDAVILLQTTDGPFLLFTNSSTDYMKWTACKINNPELQNLEWEFFIQKSGSALYLCRVQLDNSALTVSLFKAAYSGQKNITFVKQTLTGTNFSGQPINGQAASMFSKIIGAVAEKPMISNPTADLEHIDVRRLHWPEWGLRGDCYDYIMEGNKIRVCHRGCVYSFNKSGAWMWGTNVSYVIDVAANTITPDVPGRYPNVIGADVKTFNDRMPGNAAGADWCACLIRTGGINFGYSTWGRGDKPQLHSFTKSPGFAGTEFENCMAGNQYWDRQPYGQVTGLYGTPVGMSFKGLVAIGDNTIIGQNVSGKPAMAKYDPYGTYSPVIPGYGPTNERSFMDPELYGKLKGMLWVFDGDRQNVQGTVITHDHLGGPTSYTNGILGDVVNITKENYDAAVNQLTTQLVNDVTASAIRQKRISLNVCQIANVPCVGSLQILYQNPANPNELLSNCYVFEFVPDRLIGEIRTIRLVKKLRQFQANDRVIDYGGMDYQSLSPSGYYRLNDGYWLCIQVTPLTIHVGNWTSVYNCLIYDPVAKTWHEMWHDYSDPVHGEGMFGTKELGVGWVTRQFSGEGVYLRSYGKTRPEVVGVRLNGQTPKVLSIVMTRSDAGDNVAISQLAATRSKNKIQSLIPPTRTVQGMDLTQDRVIAKANIPNANKIPNMADMAYPAQQQHRNSLANVALKTHTHVAADYVLSTATNATYGASVLGNLASPDATAFRVDAVEDLTDSVPALQARPVQLVKLDNSIAVDYEV